MRNIVFGIVLLAVSLIINSAKAQSVDTTSDKVTALPGRFLGRTASKLSRLNRQLTDQTQQYLNQMSGQEKRLQAKLARLNPQSAQALFAGSTEQYASLSHRLTSDTGSGTHQLTGVYQPYLDSLHGALAFLKQHPQQLSAGRLSQLQKASSQLQMLEARMWDADQVKTFFQQRQQQIGQYLTQHAGLKSLLGSNYAALNKTTYYYSQQLRGYKELWNNPDQLEQRALALLDKTASFQSFMKDHSSLGGLFNVSGAYASGHALSGMQTKEQVSGQIQAKVSAGGAAGLTALQSNLQSAQTSLDAYKSKLSALGAGNGDAEIPDFKPNDQHTKTFWKRLEYGVNFQTTRTDYYFPTVTDLGLSLGYKLGHDNVIGIGAAYQLGWGNGIRHIAFSSQGIGLRSFLQVKIKGSFSATGGFEYNYTTPFPAFSQLPRLQDWTRSGLIGLTKTITTKGRVLKKTNLSLLWDFLSYEQIPATQPFLFRIGYTLN